MTKTTTKPTTTTKPARDGDHLAIPLGMLHFPIDRDQVKLQPAEESADGTKRKPRFAMVVNSGIPFSHPWFGTLGINLANVEFNRNQVPALASHDPDKRVGYTTKVEVTDAGLTAEGVMLSNDDAQAIINDSTEGFQFQASCYLQASKVIELEDGVEHEVNGHKMTGPGYVFEQCTMREVTFTTLGADPNTSADASLSNVAEAVRVQLSVKPNRTMTNTPEPTEPQPAPAANVDEAALRADVQKAERDRVSKILLAAAPAQAELRDKLITDGVELSDALMSLNQDMQSRTAAGITDAATGATSLAAPAPAGAAAGGADDATDAAQAKLDAMPEGEAKWKAKFSADAKLQKEFTNEGYYLSYMRNKGKQRSFGTADALKAAQEEE